MSNFGRVKSFYNGGRILKPGRDGGGYSCVGLHRDGNPKTYLVHRLVAQAFIPNPDGLNTYELAEMFGVTRSAISYVQLGKTYKNAGGVIRNKLCRHVPDEVCEKIRSDFVLRSHEFGTVALAKKYGLNRKTICHILGR